MLTHTLGLTKQINCTYVPVLKFVFSIIYLQTKIRPHLAPPGSCSHPGLRTHEALAQRSPFWQPFTIKVYATFQLSSERVAQPLVEQWFGIPHSHY